MKKSTTAKNLYNYVLDVTHPRYRVREFSEPKKAEQVITSTLRPIFKTVDGKENTKAVYKHGSLVTKLKTKHKSIPDVLIPNKSNYYRLQTNGAHEEKALFDKYKYVEVLGQITVNPLDTNPALFIATDVKVTKTSKKDSTYLKGFNNALTRTLLVTRGFICAPWWLCGHVYTDKKITLAYANFILEQADRQGWSLIGVEQIDLSTRETKTIVRVS